MSEKRTPLLKTVRRELEEWGRFWRGREYRECDQSGTSPSQLMIEIGRLGVRVQTTNTRSHRTRADAILVPGDIQQIGRIIEDLPERHRVQLIKRYLRGKIEKPRPNALLWAELAFGEQFARVRRIDLWAMMDVA